MLPPRARLRFRSNRRRHAPKHAANLLASGYACERSYIHRSEPMNGQNVFGRVRAIAVLCIGLVVGGCGGIQLPGSKPAVEDDKYLQSLYADPRLDPIRDKVPLLLRPGAIKPAYLKNETKPTVPERKAIDAWLLIRDRAQHYQAGQNGEPSPLLAQTRKQVTAAIMQLQAGKLTYAAFARRIQEIDQAHQTAARQQVKPDTSARQ